MFDDIYDAYNKEKTNGYTSFNFTTKILNICQSTDHILKGVNQSMPNSAKLRGNSINGNLFPTDISNIQLPLHTTEDFERTEILPLKEKISNLTQDKQLLFDEI